MTQIDRADDDYWSSHPLYPVDDWQYEVANGDTRQGYWEWVGAKLMQKAETIHMENMEKLKS